MGREPLVSILTPSFNQGRWLGANIASVRCQTYGNIEHVVMDGGSTDGSLDTLRSADSAVRWRSEPDGGQCDAINKAFRESRGEIIGWLNSDDAYFTRDVVEKAVEEFDRRPDVSVIYGHAVLVNADGLVLHTIWAPPFSRRWLRLHDFIIQPAAFVRRSALGERAVDPAYDSAMDWELWLRLAANHRFSRVNKIMAIDRHHPGRKSYMSDMAAADRSSLARAYGVDSGPLAMAALKAQKFGLRVMGLGLLRQTKRAELAFDGMTGGWSTLIVRQVAQLRLWMPVGSFDEPNRGTAVR